MAVELWDHQQLSVDDVFGEFMFGGSEVLLDISIRGGKSITLASIAIEFLAKHMGKKVVISTHIAVLIPQFIATFKMLEFDDYTVIKAGEKEYDANKSVVLVMEQTLFARLGTYKDLKCDLLLADEIHIRYKADRFMAIMKHLSPSYFVGTSGTCYNHLGQELNPDWTYVKGASLQDVLDLGYVVPVRYLIAKCGLEVDLKNVDKSGSDYSQESMAELYGNDKFLGDVVKTWSEVTVFDPHNVKSLWFNTTIDSCENTANKLREAGFSIFAYHSKTPKHIREKLMHSFRTGEGVMLEDIHLFNFDSRIPIVVKGLVSSGTLAVGFDEPSTEVTVMLNSTLRRNTFMQKHLRCANKTDNKTEAWCLDFGKNIEVHGPALVPYVPASLDLDSKELRAHKSKWGAKHMSVLFQTETSSREFLFDDYNRELKAIKEDTRPLSQMTVQEIVMRFKVEDSSIENMLFIAAALFKSQYGEPYEYMGFDMKTQQQVPRTCKNYYNTRSLNWILQDWQELFEEYPQHVDRWTKSFKTTLKSSFNNKKSIYGIKGFANTLRKRQVESDELEAQMKALQEKEEYELYDETIEDRPVPKIDIDEEDIPF